MENQTESSGIPGWVWGAAGIFVILAIFALTFFLDVV